jgi:hypothetical protein
MWGKIYDAVIKSLISVEKSIFDSNKVSRAAPGEFKSNFFELLGYDIMLDSDLNPWILEVNMAPSLTGDSPLDFQIKSNLIVDMLNLVGLKKLPNHRKRVTETRASCRLTNAMLN